jgi:hypothetical protein
VDFFYGERLKASAEGDTATEGITKLFLNSLYGKFGQRGERWEMVGESEDLDVRYWDYYDATGGELIKFRQFAGVIERLQGEAEARDSFPAIASHVTAYARLYLWRLMRQAGLGNVYYTDTDSLMVNRAGLDNLADRIAPNELGALKVEWESDNVTIHGLKDYVVDGKRKIKGIRKDAVALGPGVFRQDQFRGIEGMIRDGDMDRILIKTVEKRLVRQYAKGQVAASGRVFPLQLVR